MPNDKLGAVVIGSGMGGMCCAARLTAHGLKVVVVEKSPYLGGRCSHRQRNGCTITTGAIMIPMGEHSAIRQAFSAVGAPMNMVETTGAIRYRLPHGDYDLPPGRGGLLGMIEFALQGDAVQSRQLLQHFREATSASIPLDSISFRAWLEQHTVSQDVMNLFQGFCAALMGTNLHEVPAGEFFRFLKHSSRGSRFGLAAKGNGDLIESLATAIEKHGSLIHRRTACRRIVIENGRAVGIEIHSKGGGEERIAADFVVSNTGPVKTIELAGGEALFEKSYLAQLDAMPYETPIVHFSFLTDRPLIEGFAGSLVFGNTENLIYLEIPSIISPALAPAGRFLHTAYGAPRDAARPNLKVDAANTLCELEENFPGAMEGAEIIVRARHRGQAPGMHRWPGYMMPVETPIRNLFNVGDGCTPPGTIGTEGSAASAKVVAGKIADALALAD